MTSLRRLLDPPQVLRKRETIAAVGGRYQALHGRLLNVGSKDVRLGPNCVNFDLSPGPEVDVVGDAHELTRHFGLESFDTVVLSAVLQYCERPAVVIEQAAQVLRPSGVLLIDAPFLQPYCPDGLDLWRFTADGLRRLCAPHFDVLEVTPSITFGPAFAFMAQGATTRVRNRFLALPLTWIASLLLYPLRFLPYSTLEVAGAILLVGRKRTTALS